MTVRSVPQIVLDEAAGVLGELAIWVRLSPVCPKCGAALGCTHVAGCPLGRVPRLRCLLGSGDQQHRDDELAALRRQRGERTPEGDTPAPSVVAAAETQTRELPLASARGADQPEAEPERAPT
jgi:hypothetical protein